MGELTVAELDAEICSLAARINVATARLLLLVGEFDEREGWAGYGVKSCAHWLSWKCQLGAHAAREQVRVARALRGLPLIRGEFGAGRLSYAKVRALTRIAAADTEADLVELAHAATAAQLERTVAGWRRVETLEDDERARRTGLSWYFDEHGMLHLSGCLDAEQAAVLLTAQGCQIVCVRGGSRTASAGRPGKGVSVCTMTTDRRLLMASRSLCRCHHCRRAAAVKVEPPVGGTTLTAASTGAGWSAEEPRLWREGGGGELR